MFHDILERKNAFLEYKNLNLKKAKKNLRAKEGGKKKTGDWFSSIP